MSVLFTPYRIGNLEIKNRIVRSATGEGIAGADGRVDQAIVDFYDRLGEGGAGLIISGHAYVRPDGRCNVGMVGVHDDVLMDAYAQIPPVCHQHGAKIIVQINHGGRQVSLDSPGSEPICPSPVKAANVDFTPREIRADEIDGLIEAYAQAARRVKGAGFDGVQIHSAHGYLISQFNSPATNRRTDEWGGSAEKRSRFVTEVYRRVRAAVGDDFPVMIKLNVDDFLPGGITIDESKLIAKTLADLGMDAIEVSGAMAESVENVLRTPKSKDEEGYFAPPAREIRALTGVPLILTGGLRSPDVCEARIDDGTCDFVGMSRPLIRQPDLPASWEGGSRDTATCASCGKCTTTPELANVCGLDQ